MSGSSSCRGSGVRKGNIKSLAAINQLYRISFFIEGKSKKCHELYSPAFEGSAESYSNNNAIDPKKRHNWELPCSPDTGRSILLSTISFNIALYETQTHFHSSFTWSRFVLFANSIIPHWWILFIGTGGHGHILSQRHHALWYDATEPWYKTGRLGRMQRFTTTVTIRFYGFSHTHLSGTGIADYCDILFMPFTGNVQWENKDYASSFLITNEKASPATTNYCWINTI